MRTMSLLESDQTPSTFWITNPENSFVGNVVASSDAFGFWFNVPRHPGDFTSHRGATFTETVFPRHAPLGAFENNTAHSCVTGLLAHDVDPQTFDPATQTVRANHAFTRESFLMVEGGVRNVSVFCNTLTFANRQAGAVIKDNGHLQVRGFVSAEQPAGLQTLKYDADQWALPSNGMNGPLVADSLFIGGGSGRANSGIGFWGPISSFLTVRDSTFASFENGHAIAACAICNNGMGGQELCRRAEPRHVWAPV